MVGTSNHCLLSTNKTYVSYKFGKRLKTLNSHSIAAGIFRCIARSLVTHTGGALLRKQQLLEHGGWGRENRLQAEILITKKACFRLH